MKLTLKVQDNKAGFIIELLRNFDFVQIESSQGADGLVLTDAEIDILDERITSYKNASDNLQDWDEVKQDFANKN